MNVLMIDDSPIARMMLKSLLQQIGITEVAEATNGQEGLAVVSKQKLDCIILDLHMPIMDGITFIRELKKQPAWVHTPVIVISSDAERGQILEALRLGARAYVTKPFCLEQLQSALSTALPTTG